MGFGNSLQKYFQIITSQFCGRDNRTRSVRQIQPLAVRMKKQFVLRTDLDNYVSQSQLEANSQCITRQAIALVFSNTDRQVM